MNKAELKNLVRECINEILGQDQTFDSVTDQLKKKFKPQQADTLGRIWAVFTPEGQSWSNLNWNQQDILRTKQAVLKWANIHGVNAVTRDFGIRDALKQAIDNQSKPSL